MEDEVHLADPHAWVELLHAEIAHLLCEAGIPVLHLKGPTVAAWLYEPGERASGDVDVLVPPDRMQDALDTLYAHGFVDRYPGVNRRTSTDHAIAVHRLDPAIGADEVDVHDRFEGLESPRAFDILWAHREPAKLAHVDVWFPDLTTRAILICLNAARDSTSAKGLEDLRRLLAEPREWDLIVALAKRLEAIPALRAGLELDPDGRAKADELGLAPVSPEWHLRVAKAPRSALRLEELRRTPRINRPKLVARWIVPAPGIMRMRDPSLAPGALPLMRAYGQRLAQGTRGFPAALQALRRSARGE